MLIPQKVYRLHGFHKYFLLCLSLFGFFIITVSTTAIIWGLTRGWRGGIWLAGIIIGMCALFLIFAVWIFYRFWSQRLEFSLEGITLISLFFRIYAPWENIETFDRDALAPLTRGSYRAFVYKKPARLYVSVREGKKKNLTVVQTSRSRSRTNPDLMLYLTHNLPLLPEVFPKEELDGLLLMAVNKDG